LRAWAGGYFWLPCPRCGRMFGGHQAGGVLHHREEDRNSQMTCPRCRGDFLLYEGRIWRGSARYMDGKVTAILVDPVDAP
jgi:DNA-directed RNA polymerase subunit RPC12/RpoP